MGQYCSKRKRKLSDEVVVGDSVESSCRSTHPSSLENFLIEHQLSQLTTDMLTPAELANFYLLDLETFGADLRLIAHQVRIADLQIPIHFDVLLHSEFLPHTGASALFRLDTRTDVVGFYLSQVFGVLTSLPKTNLSVELAKSLLCVGARVLMGKRLNKLEMPGMSEGVALLIVAHRLVVFWQEFFLGVKDFSEFQSLSSSQILDLLVLHRSVDDLRRVGDLLQGVDGVVPDFDMKSQMFNAQAWIKQISQFAAQPLLSSYLLEKLRVVAVSRREKLAQNSLVQKISEIVQVPSLIKNSLSRAQLVLGVIGAPIEFGSSTLAILRHLYQLLPMRGSVGGEGWEQVMEESDVWEEIFDLVDLVENFFAFKLKRQTLSDIRGLRNTALLRQELFMQSVVRAGLRQWLDAPKIAPSLMSAKGADAWWTSFLPNVFLLEQRLVPGVSPDLVVKGLFAFLIENEFADNGPQLISPDVVRRTLIAAAAERWYPDFLETLAREAFSCSNFVEGNELEFLALIAPVAPATHKALLNLVTIKQLIAKIAFSKIESVKSKKLFNLFSDAIGELGVNRRKLELHANALCSAEFGESTSLVSLKFLIQNNPLKIFRNLFIFNPNAFLETDLIHSLRQRLGIDEDTQEYANILNFAGMAYVGCGELDGARSILRRLVQDYHYPDSWRLADRLMKAGAAVPGDLLTGAVALCTNDKLADLVDFMQPRLSVREVHPTMKPTEYLQVFPTLSHNDSVDKYLRLLGVEADEQVSFDIAELLAGLPSLIDPKFGAFMLSARKASMMVS